MKAPLLIRPVCEQQQVVEVPSAVTHEVGQHRFGFEAQVLEHGHERFLLGYDLDIGMAAAELERVQQGGPGQRAPYPQPAMCRGHEDS